MREKNEDLFNFSLEISKARAHEVKKENYY